MKQETKTLAWTASQFPRVSEPPDKLDSEKGFLITQHDRIAKR